MPIISKQAATKPPAKRIIGGNILNSITPVANLPETGLKFLIFGPQGSGKTTLACSFPKPLLFIRPEQVEDGSLSIRTVKGVDAPRQLETPDELDLLTDMVAITGKYKTIVLDGVTKFQDLCLKKVLGLSDVPAQLNWGIATQETWGIVTNELKEHLRKMLRLAMDGVNIVILGGERELDSKRNASVLNAPYVMIALTPASMGWLHEVCDYNVRTFIQRKMIETTTEIAGQQTTVMQPGDGFDYCIRTGPHDVYQTKFRKPKGQQLPEIIIDPSYEKIRKLIQGG